MKERDDGERSVLEAGLRSYWSGEASPVARGVLGAVTAPMAAIFGVGVRLRNLGYDRGWLTREEPPLPVISVGNLAVGGTGKTPFTGWLVSHLLRRDERPAVVARGYGEDELLLHRRWHPGVPVLEAPRRVEGVRRAAEHACTFAVVDDGFQHRRLARALDIVLLSPAQPLPARLLPRGPYREPIGALRRADLVLVSRKNSGEHDAAENMVLEVRAWNPEAPVELLGFGAGAWTDLDGVPVPPPAPPVLAVASVAEPAGFRRLVRERLPGADDGRGVELLTYPDHHPYTRDDVARILARAGNRPVVTTEKDAVKITRLLPSGGNEPQADRTRFVVLPLAAEPGRRVVRRLDELLDRLGTGMAHEHEPRWGATE